MAAMRILRHALIVACATGAGLSAQESKTSPELEKALLIERAEHDLRGAGDLYEKIARDEATPPLVRGRAWLRLGTVRQKLGDDEAARVALEAAVRAGGDAGEEARALLQDPDRDQDRARQVRERARELVEQLVVRMRRAKSSYPSLVTNAEFSIACSAHRRISHAAAAGAASEGGGASRCNNTPTIWRSTRCVPMGRRSKCWRISSLLGSIVGAPGCGGVASGHSISVNAAQAPRSPPACQLS